MGHADDRSFLYHRCLPGPGADRMVGQRADAYLAGGRSNEFGVSADSGGDDRALGDCLCAR